MILWFIGTVLTSVIITLSIVYGGVVWYNKRLEQKAKEATKEITRALKELNQQEDDLTNYFHNTINKGDILQ